MIKFLSNWIEQIALTVIIVSIIELILPNGNLKKYIKVILGVYIIFCIISPFVNKTKLYNIQNIDINKYAQNTSDTKENQTSINERIKEIYIEQLKKDISVKVKESGYKVSKCDIEAELDSEGKNPGIHKINLVLNKNIGSVEKIEIGTKKEENNNAEEEKIKENIAKYYEIDENLINIKIK